VLGRLSIWEADKGYGFLQPEDNSGDVFVHVRDFVKEDRNIEIGQLYSFEVETDPQGRMRAKRVRTIVQAAPESSSINPVERSVRYLVIIAFAILVGSIWQVQPIPPAILYVYIISCALCFAGYGFDKQAALSGKWRISETVLILLGLVGGWPGAILAQEVFRHKTRKRSFRAIFWMSVSINILAFPLIAASQAG
jgi:uncharacterized membrane protein YsdA (DUF1294 family)/cold shock CspA family protein